MASYSCKKFSPTACSLVTVHPLWTDEQTDTRMDDNHANSSTVT